MIVIIISSYWIDINIAKINSMQNVIVACAKERIKGDTIAMILHQPGNHAETNMQPSGILQQPLSNTLSTT